MSNALLTRVWSLKGLDPSLKLVLARLADMANDAGICWPSITKMEEDTGLARSSVCRIVTTLETVGLVLREKGRASNTYTLTLENWTPEMEPKTKRPTPKIKPKSAPCQSDHETSKTETVVPPSDQTSPTTLLDLVPPSDQTSPTIGTKPKRTINRTLSEPKGELGLLVDPLPFTSSAFAAAWAEWEEHRRQKKAKITDASKRKQFKALLAMGEARAIAAIEHSIANNWQGIFEPRHVPAWQQPAGPSTEYDFGQDAKNTPIDFAANFAEMRRRRERHEKILGGEIEPETDEERALVYAD